MKIICIASYFINLQQTKHLKDLAHHFEIHVVDVREVFTSNYHTISSNKPFEQTDNIHVHKFNNTKTLRIFLEKHRNAIVMKCFTDRWQDWYLHLIVKRMNLYFIAYIATSNIFNFQYTRETNIVQKIFIKLKKGPNAFFNLLIFLGFRLLHLTNLAPKLDIAFLPSKSELFALMKYNMITDFCFINDSKYDACIENKPIMKEDYIVFLAQNFPYATYDLKAEAEKRIDRTTYSQEILRTLQFLETTYAKKIVVCTHPKYHLPDSIRDFGHIEVIQGETEKYINNAFLVVTHFSSAVNYAILLKKKILLLNSNLFFNNRWVNESISTYKRLLNLPELNMSSLAESTYDKMINLDIDDEAYEVFIKDFMSHSYPVYYPSHIVFKNYLLLKYKDKN